MKKNKKIFAAIFAVLACFQLNAQEGAYSGYSPYSVYGIGDLSRDGNACNKSMGGTGIASRNKRYLNTMNPAAVTARDTLSFMCNFGLTENNKIYSGSGVLSANNTFNISDFSMSFPIYRTLACMVGVSQFSEVGYDFSSIETDPATVAMMGNMSYEAYGQGGLNQLFLAAGVNLSRNLAVGAQAIYYFGNTDKISNTIFSESATRSINSGHNLQLHGLTGKLGMQYNHKLSDDMSMTAGATYRFRTNLKGHTDMYSFAISSEMADTLNNKVTKLSASDGLKLGNELGLGVSVSNGERWSAEFNYVFSDWSGSNFENTEGFSVNGIGGAVFSSTVSHSFRAGFEYVPNRNDIRYYFKKVTYRGGIYYNQSYYKLDGNLVDSKGMTFGITLPVFPPLYNGVSLGVDIGQKGSAKGHMIRENYITFNVGFNMHDIWFQKHRYL